MTARRLVARFGFALVLAGLTMGWQAPVASQEDGQRFFIVGYVKAPGSYSFKGGLTVGDAIERAGGFVEQRTVTSIEIMRTVDGTRELSIAGMNDPVLHNDTIALK